MKRENKMIHSPPQWQTLADDPAVGTVCMVNLLKFYGIAEYEDGRDTKLTGMSAITGFAVL